MNKRIVPFVPLLLLCVVTAGHSTIHNGKNDFPPAVDSDLDQYPKLDDNPKVDKFRRLSGTDKAACTLNSVESPAECVNPGGYYLKLNNTYGIIFNEYGTDNRVYNPYDTIAQNNNSNFVLKKEDIEMVQDALNKLGYNAGKVDGLAHNKTSNAIVEFQRKEGLPITGEIDQQLLELLKIR